MMGRWSKKPGTEDVKAAPLDSSALEKSAERASTSAPPLASMTGSSPKTPLAAAPPEAPARPPASDASVVRASPETASSRPAFNGSPVVSQPPAMAGQTITPITVLGDIVWLMSQSLAHKQFFISDLEWFVMPPILLGQVSVFRGKAPNPHNGDRPIGAVMWAFARPDVAERLTSGLARLRPQDWKSGDEPWIVHVIAPFGGAEQMVKEVKARTFADRELRYFAIGTDGKKETRVA